MNNPELDTPARRYGPLSRMLSGVRLFSRDDIPHGESGFFPDTRPDAFCGRWNLEDLCDDFAGTGCLEQWKKQGYHKIWLETPPHSFPNRHQLTVWTRIGNCAEILMQIVIWLEFTEIEAMNHVVLPAFCVEHLRLQRPGAEYDGPLLPGQDFAPSGMLRRIFAIIGKWAAATGAAIITEIPEFFHTACIFSRYFQFADPGMEAVFRAVKRDLVPEFSHTQIADVSEAFENNRILYQNAPYLWPTELQIYPLNPDIRTKINAVEIPVLHEHIFQMRNDHEKK